MNTNFTWGCAKSGDTITFVAFDLQDPDFEDASGPSYLVELSGGRWRRRKINDRLEKLALDPAGQVMALTSARLFIRPALDGPIEKISEPRPPLAGQLHGLRAIGSSIYTCGGNGLIFRRDGERWRPFAEELQTPFPTSPENHFMVIDGMNEDQIYLLAHQGIFFWDGARGYNLESPSKTLVVSMYIERSDLIWLCGWNGLLMHGSYHKGFKRVDHPGRQMFLSVAEFDGRIYLAGDNKLWVYDGTGIVRANVGRATYRPIRNLTRAGDALWAVGDDIFRLTTSGRWEHIPYDPPWR